MIIKYVNRFNERRDLIANKFKESHPDSYFDIVKTVVESLSDGDDYGEMDVDRIHQIDDGNYQGTLVYLIGEAGYQPCKYWLVKVDYGSCSGCDTLESIRKYSDDAPTDEQVKDYVTLALHIVQGLKEV